MSHVLLLVALGASSPDAAARAAPSTSARSRDMAPSTSEDAAWIDDASVSDGVETVMAGAPDAVVRVAVAAASPPDGAARAAVALAAAAKAIVRAPVDRQREEIVSAADPARALSAIAPGWRQADNGEGAKVVAAAIAAAGAYERTAAASGRGVGGVIAHGRDADIGALDAVAPSERGRRAVREAKELGDALHASSLLAAAATATVWSLGIVDAAVRGEPGSR